MSRKKEWYAAVKYWEELIAQKKTCRQGYVKIVRAYKNLGLQERAETFCVEGLFHFPTHRGLLIESARLEAYGNNWDDAVSKWSQVAACYADGMPTGLFYEACIAEFCRDKKSEYAIFEYYGGEVVSAKSLIGLAKGSKLFRVHKLGLLDGFQVFEKISPSNHVNKREVLVNKLLAPSLVEEGVNIPRFILSLEGFSVLSIIYEYIEDAENFVPCSKNLPMLVDQFRKLAAVRLDSERAEELKGSDSNHSPSTGIQKIKNLVCNDLDSYEKRCSFFYEMVLEVEGNFPGLKTAVEKLVLLSTSRNAYFLKTCRETKFGFTHFDLHAENVVYSPSRGKPYILDMVYADVAPYGFDLALYAVSNEHEFSFFQKNYVDAFFEADYMDGLEEILKANMYLFYVIAALYLRPEWAKKNIETSVHPAIDQFSSYSKKACGSRLIDV